MKFLKKHWKLLIIVFIAFWIRVWNVWSVPPSLNWDEAALGYNAYSLLQTGKDEYGVFLPLTLKSFGDYKPAFYAYLDIPFVALFGLNELAVRLPSLVFGTGLIILIYIFAKQLFNELNGQKSEFIALCTAGMLTISQLGIEFSRAAWESNVAVFLNTLGTVFFIKGWKNQKYFICSVLAFGISLFTYQGSRLFVPVLIMGLLIFYLRKLKYDKYLLISSLIFVAVLCLLAHEIFGLGQTGRLQTENFFAYTRDPALIRQISREDGLPVNSFLFQFLHGEWFAYVRGLVERYVEYFSPNVLFVTGDYSPRHNVPDLGIVLYISVILMPLGFIYLLRRKSTYLPVILLWLFLSPLPGVLSRDLISMVRVLNIMIPFALLDGLGLFVVLNYTLLIKKPLVSGAIVTVLGVVILFNVAIFFDRYFVHMPQEYGLGWVYGYKQAVQTINQLSARHQYNKIVLTDSLGQPYIYYLFYSQYPPAKYQTQAKLAQTGVDVGTVRQVDNIEFRHIYWPTDRGSANSLFIGTKDELPDQDITSQSNFKWIKNINFLNGTDNLRVVEVE